MSWQMSWRAFFFFLSQGGNFPAVWQQKCVNKLEPLSRSFPPVSFSLNNFPSRSWGLCLPFIPSNWILATGCQEEDWGAVCLCQLHLLPPEAALGNVQPPRTEARNLGLICWACMWEAASWLWGGLPSALPAKGAKQTLAGGLAHFPCYSGGPAGLFDSCTWRPHSADGSGAAAAKAAWVWRFLCTPLCWVISCSHAKIVHRGKESGLPSWPALCSPWL